MPRHTPSGNYPNVNQIADLQGLIWDGHAGSPYDLQGLIAPELWAEQVAEDYEDLFDHTIRFRPRGSGARPPVMAVTAPYRRNDERLWEETLSFCARFGLAARVGDERYRIYVPPRTLPIVFWRPDRHLLR